MADSRRNIVVTGASQGIGAAIARSLADERTHLSLVARNRDRLEAVAESCRDRGAKTLVLQVDVTDEDAVRKMAAVSCDAAGIPAVVVNNAGAFVPGSVADTSPRVFRDQVEVNLTSAFLVTRAFLPGMLRVRAGHMVFMASVASVRGYPAGASYCAAKHGLLGLARALREETRPAGIRVTTILPGAVRTPSWDGTELPDERFMPAEDIAEAVRAAIDMSGRTVVEEMLLRPQLGDL